jgi:hypothetical protein
VRCRIYHAVGKVSPQHPIIAKKGSCDFGCILAWPMGDIPDRLFRCGLLFGVRDFYNRHAA